MGTKGAENISKCLDGITTENVDITEALAATYYHEGLNRKTSEKHYRRIKEVAPKTGTVRLLRLTEKQYNNICMVTGETDYQEKTVGINCHIMI